MMAARKHCFPEMRRNNWVTTRVVAPLAVSPTCHVIIFYECPFTSEILAAHQETQVAVTTTLVCSCLELPCVIQVVAAGRPVRRLCAGPCFEPSTTYRHFAHRQPLLFTATTRRCVAAIAAMRHALRPSGRGAQVGRYTYNLRSENPAPLVNVTGCVAAEPMQ